MDASGEHKLFVTKQGKTGSQAWVRQTIEYEYEYALSLFINSDKGPLFEKKLMALNGLHLFIHSHPTTPSKIRYSTEMYLELTVALHFG